MRVAVSLVAEELRVLVVAVQEAVRGVAGPARCVPFWILLAHTGFGSACAVAWR